MNLLEKINKFIPLILVIGGLIFLFLMNKDINTSMTQNFELLERNLAVSQTNQVENLSQLTEVMNNLTESSSIILERLEEMGAEPVIITHTTGGISGSSNTIYITNPSDIPEEFTFLTKDGMVVARYEVIDEDGEQTFNTETYDIEVGLDTIVAFSEEDANAITVIVEGTVSSSYDDAIFPLDILDSQTYYRPLDPNELHLWDPHVDIGATGHYNFETGEFSGGVTPGFTPSSYGTGDEDVLRFLRVGAMFNADTIEGNISPIGYNLGSALPVISDTWLYPTLGTDFSSDITLGLTLSSTF